MPLPASFQSIYLIIASIFTFVWANNPTFSKFTFHLIFLLLIFLFFHHLFHKTKSSGKAIIKHQYTSNIVIITTVTLLLVLNTGGLTSPLFFLVHLLLFTLTLFSHPIPGLTVSLALSFLFLLNTDITTTYDLITLFSLILMTPIAQIFGTQYLKLLEDKNQIKILKHQSKQLKSQLIKEETTTLIWLSIEFRNKIGHAIDLVSQLSSNLSNLPYHQRNNLDSIYQDLKALFQSGQELEEKIDQITDET